MPALNFQPWKADLVMRGRSLQTIRRELNLIRPGSQLFFYCGQRTKYCYKLGEGTCTETEQVVLSPDRVTTTTLGRVFDIDGFAALDGFKNYEKMWAFFLDRYFLAIEQSDGSFYGHRIKWRLDADVQKNCVKNYQRLKREGFFKLRPRKSDD